MQPHHPSRPVPIAYLQQTFGYVSFAETLAVVDMVVLMPMPTMTIRHISMPLNWKLSVFGTMPVTGMSTD